MNRNEKWKGVGGGKASHQGAFTDPVPDKRRAEGDGGGEGRVGPPARDLRGSSRSAPTKRTPPSKLTIVTYT